MKVFQKLNMGRDIENSAARSLFYFFFGNFPIIKLDMKDSAILSSVLILC